uniref:cation:proton antiporter domain-containing protein n=1 Tax=Salmonella enterica TaxID=28901 RepID=UPI001CCF6E92
EWVHVQLHQQKGMISLSPPTICNSAEKTLGERALFSGLLAVMGMGVTLLKTNAPVAKRISGKFSKLWVAAEIWLFVLVGATVNIRYLFSAGLSGMLLITAALLFRMLGVWMSTLGTDLSRKERLFCMIAYLPKATGHCCK